MRYFILDTNILLAYLKAGNNLFQRVSRENELDKEDALIIISVISKGELLSLAMQNNWGEGKMNNLERLLNQFVSIDVNGANSALLSAYAEIDAYSHKRPPSKTYIGSARTMAKNDVWIAATASAADATLITTDADFNHLNNVFIQVKYYDINEDV